MLYSLCFARTPPDTSCRENALKILAWIPLGPAGNQLWKENKGFGGPGSSGLSVLHAEGIFLFFNFVCVLKEESTWNS